MGEMYIVISGNAQIDTVCCPSLCEVLDGSDTAILRLLLTQ